MLDGVASKQSLIDSAQYGSDVASIIDEAISKELPDDFGELTAYAHRIRLCNRKRNQWLGEDLHNADGECYNATGRLWTCGLKLCSYCIAKQARRNRTRARTALSRDKLTGYETYKFVTLTMPNPGKSVTETRVLIYTAWTLLRKLKFWRERVFGYIKDEEFTVTKAGINYHIHLIIRSKFIPKDILRTAWTYCLRSSFAGADLPLTINTADDLAICDIRKITSLDAAIKECCKYITKSSSWRDLPRTHLLDICRIRRFNRMFELGGVFRQTTATTDAEKKRRYKIETRLDTTGLSDGTLFEHWRDTAEKRDPLQYLRSLHAQVENNSAFRRHQLRRKFPYAKLTQLKDDNPNDLKEAAVRLAVLQFRYTTPNPTEKELYYVRERAFNHV